MLPEIVIFGKTISTYGMTGATGFVLGLIWIALASRKRGVSAEDGIYIYVFGMLGVLLGAKILYLLTVLPQLLRDIPLFRENFAEFSARYLTGGFVFYGGLLGAIAGSFLAARMFRKRPGDFYPTVLPAFVLFAALGRIGCFCAGCCYGHPTDLPIGVTFVHSRFAPTGVSLLPVQLFEAAFDLVLFAILAFAGRQKNLQKKGFKRESLLILYLASYAAFRFILEFFRGDSDRGIIGPFSVSQWVSLAILLFLAIKSAGINA